MSFQVNSVSTITAPCRRFALRVMQRSRVEGSISYAGVFACRPIAGSSTWSQHSWGNAIDMFAAPEHLAVIAGNVVLQGTKRTKANHGRKIPLAHVIYKDRIWTPGIGWHDFTGTYHGNHVHVDFLPYKTGKPPCA